MKKSYVDKRVIIDIILPCFNPDKNWASNVVETYGILIKKLENCSFNLIIVDDGSAKGITPEHILYLKKKINNFKWIGYENNKGKGYALRMGVKYSIGEYIILTDIDFPYTNDSMIQMIMELIKNDADILAGQRNDNYYQHTPFFRKIISKFLKYIVKHLLKIDVSDTQCGLKGFNSIAKEAFLSTTINRYLFDLEFLWIAGKKYKIKPFPVHLKENITFSTMNSKILLNEGINFLKFFINTLMPK